MKILPLYILREHLGPFLFGLFIITFVLVMDFILEILNLIITRGLNAYTVLQMFGLNLAWMLALSIPMAVLVATLMAFGRMSADNEITALRANGVSLYRLVTPVVIASVVIALGLVWFNNKVLPDANHKARLLMTQIYQKRPTLNIKENVFIDQIPGYHILIKKIDPRSTKIEDILIYDQRERLIPRTIFAKRGNLEFSADGNTLILELYEGEIHESDEKDPTQYRRVTFDKQVIFIGDVGSEFTASGSDYRTDREMSVTKMRQEVKLIQEQIAPQSEKIKELGAVLDTFPDPSEEKAVREFTPEERQLFHQRQRLVRDKLQAEQIIQQSQHRINSYLVEIHKKFSIPVACLVFVLLGAPLGIMARRGNIVIGLGLSLGFFVLYWAFLIAGEELADRMIISPFSAMWSANILIGAAGFYLIVKSAREIKFLSWAWLEKIIPAKLRKFLGLA
jgi:lipopolysaccharide export system permease protein